jgi:cytochrome P450
LSATAQSADALVYPALEHAECPFPLFAQLREERPVHAVPGRDGEFLITRHEDLVYVTSHPELFSSTPTDVPWSPGWSETMIAQDPPQHTPTRRVAQRSFTPGKVKSYEPVVTEIVDGLIDDFIDKGEVEFCTAFANPLSLFVTSALMGLPRKDASWLERLLAPFEAQGIRYHSAERQRIQEHNGALAVAYLREHVLDRIAHPGDDMISELVRNHIAATGAEPNVEYLAVETNVLLAGGLTTSGHLFASAMSLLVQNPERLAQVRADQTLIPRMLEEVLRLESPAQYQPRYATQDTELNGVQIPKGSCLLIVYAAANRDPERFECPDEFRPDRENVQKHVGWGHGAHFCLGAPLARLEGRIAFERLFERLDDIRPAPGRNDFSHYETLYFRAPNSLHLWFQRAGRDPFGLVAEGEPLLP